MLFFRRKYVRGRDKFNKYKKILTISARLFRFCPTFIKNAIWNISNLIPGTVGIGIRYSLVKAAAKDCGENVLIGTNVIIKNIENLKIGNNVSIHDQCYIDATGEVIINNDVSIAHHTSILSTNHTWENLTIPIRDNNIVKSKVEICEDVWIGCGCRVLSGITIGSRSVIAAGSVVNKDIFNNSLVGGVPARKIKDI